jgi:hypothetical protein
MTKEASTAQDGKECNNQEKVQGWIRTLWPLVATTVALFMAYQQLESRVTAVEKTQEEMKNAIVCLQTSQGETNVALGILNTNIDNLNTNVSRIVDILDQED